MVTGRSCPFIDANDIYYPPWKRPGIHSPNAQILQHQILVRENRGPQIRVMIFQFPIPTAHRSIDEAYSGSPEDSARDRRSGSGLVLALPDRDNPAVPAHETKGAHSR